MEKQLASGSYGTKSPFTPHDILIASRNKQFLGGSASLSASLSVSLAVSLTVSLAVSLSVSITSIGRWVYQLRALNNVPEFGYCAIEIRRRYWMLSE